MLLNSDKNIYLDSQKIELYCSILTGKNVNWSIEINKWVNRIDNELMINEIMMEVNVPAKALIKKHKKTFKRERLHLKTEIDFIDHISATKSLFSSALSAKQSANVTSHDPLSMPDSESSDSVQTKHDPIDYIPTDHEPTKYELSEPEPAEPEYEPEIKSTMFNKQLSANAVGIALGNFWKLLETQFVDNIENCFMYRRILLYEQEFYIILINKHFNDILNRQNIMKIELVKRLQSDLCNIPENALIIPNITKQLLVAVSDTRIILKQITYQKIEKCRQFIGNETIDNWLDKQITSMFMIYKFILQTEVCSTLYTYHAMIFLL